MKIAGIFLQGNELVPMLDPDPEEPLGIEYILSSAQRKGHEVHLFTLLEKSFDQLLSSVLRYSPDIVAVSVFTKHAPQTLLLAKRLKQTHPDIFIVMGGPHPTADPCFVLSPYIDACVLGEGEVTFCELLDALQNNNCLTQVRGLALEKNGEVYFTGKRGRNEDLDTLSFPLRETNYYSFPAYSISYPTMSQCNWRPVLFSRGCTMPCRFCSSRDLWGNQVCFRSAQNVISEIRQLRDSQGVNFVFFEDLTFTLNKRRFAELCNLLKDENLGIKWACETHVNTIDAASVAMLESAGCTKILWGIENLNDDNLVKIHKRQTVADIKNSLNIASSQGILNWGCCIIGFPWENEEDMLGLAGLLPDIDIHQLRISIATPFPGSQWHKEIEKSSLNPDLSLYDTNHLVYDHPTISPERMKELQNEVFTRFYRSPKYHERVVKMTKRFPHLKESFDEFMAYIDSQIALLESGQTEITQTYTHPDSIRQEAAI